MFNKLFFQKSKHILFNKHFFFKNRAVSEIMWKKYEHCKDGEATDKNIIWRIRITPWILRATNTHSEYIIITAFPLQQ